MTVLSANRFDIKPFDVADDSDEDQVGDIISSAVNINLLYGLSDKVNLKLNIPYKRWLQYNVENEDTHQRNESIDGMGDISLGMRTVIQNDMVGPGHRFFVDGDIFIPTGRHFSINPYGELADSVDHQHFAPGKGHYSARIGIEWWQRTEFPVIIGISAAYQKALNKSKLDFSAGNRMELAIHSIGQKALIPKVFPYVKLLYREKSTDNWEGVPSPDNSGKYFEGYIMATVELTEKISTVIFTRIPIWDSVDGSQFSGKNLGFSIRYIH